MWCGTKHAVFFDSSDQVWGLGWNDVGQLGLGDTKQAKVPCRIPNLRDIKQVACGFWFTVFLDLSGSVWFTGSSLRGEYKPGSRHHSVPIQVSGLPPIVSIQCGTNHTICIDENSSMWSFGYNANGQLGLGDFEATDIPMKIPNADNIRLYSTGGHHTIFINASGEAFSFGRNDFHQLGHPGSSSCPTPKVIEWMKDYDIVSISVGMMHSAFLTSVGEVYLLGSVGLQHEKGEHDTVLLMDNVEDISSGYSCLFCIDKERKFHYFGTSKHPKSLRKQVGLVADISQGGDRVFVRSAEQKMWYVDCDSSHDDTKPCRVLDFGGIDLARPISVNTQKSARNT